MKPDFGSAHLGAGVGRCMPSPKTAGGASATAQKVIYTESDDVLRSVDYLMVLAKAIEEIDLGRETTTDWLADRIYSLKGIIKTFEGKTIEIYPEIFEDAYGADGTWNSDVKRFAKRRPLRRPKHTLLLRFQLWDAAFKIIGRPLILPRS